MNEDIEPEVTKSIAAQMGRWVQERRDNVAIQLATKMMRVRVDDQPGMAADNDAMGILGSMDDTNMEEVMINAATDAQFEEWEKTVLAPSVARELIRTKYGGEKDTKKENNAINKPNKMLTILQHLACWLVYVYKDIGNVEDGNLLFDDYHKRRYQTTTCKNAAGLLLGALIIPNLLGKVGPNTCDAVEVAGTCPFYLEACFSKMHNSWATFWEETFEFSQSDTADIQERKFKYRKLLGLLHFDTIRGSDIKVIKKVTTTYTEREKMNKLTKKDEQDNKDKDAAYPAFKLFSTLCTYLGLVVKSTAKDPRPVYKCASTSREDGKKMPGYRIIALQAQDFALLLLTKKRIINRVRYMLPELVHSGNLSDHGKEFFMDAITRYNNALDHMVGIGDPTAPVDHQMRRITQ